MKFDITVDGGYRADIEFSPDGKGGFSGTVSNAQYGTGQIAGSLIGDEMKGNITLDGYSATFDATISSSGATILGRIIYGFLPFSFTGVSA